MSLLSYKELRMMRNANCSFVMALLVCMTSSVFFVPWSVHAKDPESFRIEGSKAPLEYRLERLNQAASADGDCMLKLSNTESGKVVTSKIIIPSRTSSEKYELLGSTDAITPSQSAHLKSFLSNLDTCRVQQRSKFANVPGFTSLFRRYELQLDIALARLLKSQTSIGEFNQSKLKFEQDLLAGLELEEEKFEKESKQESVKPKLPARSNNQQEPAATSESPIRTAPKSESQTILETQISNGKTDSPPSQASVRPPENPSLKNTGKTSRVLQPKSLERRAESLGYPQPLIPQLEIFSTSQARRIDYLRAPSGEVGYPPGATIQASKSPISNPADMPTIAQGLPNSEKFDSLAVPTARSQKKELSAKNSKMKDKPQIARRTKKTGTERKPKFG